MAADGRNRIGHRRERVTAISSKFHRKLRASKFDEPSSVQRPSMTRALLSSMSLPFVDFDAPIQQEPAKMPCRPLHEFHVAVAGNDHAHRDPAAPGPEQFAGPGPAGENRPSKTAIRGGQSAAAAQKCTSQPPLAKPGREAKK